jgi:hypothetical protein
MRAEMFYPNLHRNNNNASITACWYIICDGEWCPLRGFDALPVYQLTTLIEAVRGLSPDRTRVNALF